MSTLVSKELLQEIIAEKRAAGEDVTNLEQELAEYGQRISTTHSGLYSMTREINGQRFTIKSSAPVDESHFKGLDEYEIDPEDGCLVLKSEYR